ncbi:MAG: hypothetical protein HQ518_21850 [Rhodopirellula sp.]|nr:hypothetical protein [Rhodopirellula sp.]
MRQSQQIYFYCTAAEQRDLADYSVDQGCALISEYTDAPNAEVVDWDELDRHKVYLCPAGLLNEVLFQSLGNGRHAVTFTVSPVIEFSLSAMRMRKKVLSRGRLYVNFGYNGRNGWVSYADTLADTHKAIVSHLKRRILTKERYLGGYISNAAKVLQDEGWQLAQF